MAIDAYSLCPGGTGKKIKFCCGDFLPELQKIDRMIDGEQFLACLQHVDHLLAHEPGRDRPCLLATKCMLLRFTDRQEAARTAAAAFLVKHPDNQIALAEMAILAAESNTLAALGLLQKAMRRQRRPRRPHLSGDGADGRQPAASGLSAGRRRAAATAMRHHRQGRSRGGSARRAQPGDRCAAAAARRSALGALSQRRTVGSSF